MSGSNNYYSDYGSGTSGSSSNSSTSWPSMDTWSTSPAPSGRLTKSNDQTPASFNDLVNGRCTLEDIMKEFQMNGSDAPYTPVEDRIWGNPATSLSGMGPGSAYLRQKSWPAPERSPAPPLHAPHAPHALHSLPALNTLNTLNTLPTDNMLHTQYTLPTDNMLHTQYTLPTEPTPNTPQVPENDWLSAVEFKPKEFNCTSTPIEEPSTTAPTAAASCSAALRVVRALPDAALFALLQQLELARDGHKRSRRLASECRFCKNNGERESYYRSHALKEAGGRVTCPVLRAFTCARCGAAGDSAHTIKYCPLSTADERLKSAAMMRSVRLASGRRRAPSVSPRSHYVMFGDTTPPPSVVSDNSALNCYSTSPLDPLWAALEQKLLL